MPLPSCFAAKAALAGSPPRSAAAVRAEQVDGPNKLLQRSAPLSRKALFPHCGF